MKWTAENDRQTQTTPVKCAEVAAAWPDGRGERPTTRAIYERINKLKKSYNNNTGDGNTAADVATPATPRHRPGPIGTPASKRRRLVDEPAGRRSATPDRMSTTAAALADAGPAAGAAAVPSRNTTPSVILASEHAPMSFPGHASSSMSTFASASGSGSGSATASAPAPAPASTSASGSGTASHSHPPRPASLHPRDMSAYLNDFIARTPVSMEPAIVVPSSMDTPATRLSRLSVTPGSTEETAIKLEDSFGANDPRFLLDSTAMTDDEGFSDLGDADEI